MKKVLIILPYANAHLGLFYKYIEKQFDTTYYINSKAENYRKFLSNNSVEKPSINAIFICRKIRKNYFDIIFTHGAFYPFDLMLLFAKNKPVIILSELFKEGYNTGFSGFLKKLHFSILTKRNKVSLFYFGTDIVESQYKQLTKYNFKAYKYGMYPELSFAQVERSESTKPVRFIFAGQFIERKNIKLLLEAITINNAFESGEAEFLFIGEGPQKNIIVSNKFAQYISALPADALFTELTKADVLVLVSSFEGWGAIVNSACAAGCALLLSKNIGAAELFMEENTNGVFTDINPSAISEKFQFFVTHPNDLENMKIASQTIFNKRYKEHDNHLEEITSKAITEIQ